MNAIFKVIWNRSLNIWVAVGEFAKGKQKSTTTQRSFTSQFILDTLNHHIQPKIAILAVAVMGALGIQPALAITAAQCTAMGASCVAVGTAASLATALSNTGAGSAATTILLTANIDLSTAYSLGMTVNQTTNARQNLVIDGGGYDLKFAGYAFNMYAGSTNNVAWAAENATFKLTNFNDITSTLATTSGTISRLVYVQDATTRLDVTLDEINSVPNGKLVAMGLDGAAAAPNDFGRVIFGDITQPVTLNFGTYRQLVLANNIAFTGHFDLTAIASPDYPAVFWSNGSAANSVLTFASGSDVSITGTRLTNGLAIVGVGVPSYNYMIEDGAKLSLVIDGQNPLGLANYGVQIGSYNTATGLFGAGAVINMNNLAGDVISNAPSTVATAYIYNGPASTRDVIYNLAAGSNLVVAAGAGNDGITASKTLAGTGGIYIRSAATISDGTLNTTAGTGINVSAASSGNVVIRNEAEGTIRKATGITVTDSGSGSVNITNAGTINSTTAGLSISATTAKTVSVDNTGGTISASGGTGVNILANALLNMVGGTITTTGAATGFTFAGTTNSHVLTDLILNVNGAGAAFSKAAGVNLTLNHVILNTVTGTALDSLAGLTFADSANGRNEINVTGTGTGIATVNTALTGWSPAALDINVSGAGTGINASGGGVDLSSANLSVNVTNSGGTGLRVTDGAVTATTIGANARINAAGATAINFAGTTAKTLNNNGTINGGVIFGGTAANIINNNAILNGTLTTGSGNDTLVLGSASESTGAINLGDGNNNVTIQNGTQVSSINTGVGDDTFTINGMTLGSTYLGSLNAGTGTNTLNINTSTDTLATGTSLQGFANINLTDSLITLTSDANIGSGAINIDSTSDLLFGSTFNGTLNASLGHVSGGDGSAIVNNGANVTLSQASAFVGNWQVDQGGILAASNSNQLGTTEIALNGRLNLNGVAVSNNALTGNGTLNIDTANNTFNFGVNTGSAFAGTVDMQNSIFALSGNNTAALNNASFIASVGTTVAVDNSNQTIGNFTLNGATAAFGSGSLITTDTLAVTDDSIIRVDPALTTGGNLLDQDTGNSAQLINSTNVLSTTELARLTLQNIVGGTLGNGTTENIIQGGNTVAEALYNYALSGSGGLSVTSALTQLNLLAGESLTLTSQGAVNADNTLVAQLTGAGNLIIGADNSATTLTNATNNYTGSTSVNGGILTLGSNDALGQTSALNTVAGTSANINGHSQTVGALTNAGTVTLGTGGALSSGLLTNSNILNIAGGTLNLSAGGASTATGGLTGSGTLNINGGDLALSAANSGLAGQTNIASGASATLSGAGTLGSSAVNVLGDLNLNGANAALANVLSGNGDINTNAAVTLTGTNSFSGAHHIGAAGELTVAQASNLGASTATVNLDTATSHLVLNGVNGTVANVLSGVAGSVVDVTTGANTSLTGNNSNFLGQYAVAGNSKLTVGSTNNLGAAANIALAGAQDILALSGFNGTFANTVTGSGILQVTGGSNATLTSSNAVDNAVAVDITNATLNLTDIALFDHGLTGNGTLNIDTANNTFNFGVNTGSAFAGTVDMQNSIFALSGNNTAALNNASFIASVGTTVAVDNSNQTIGNFTLNGATAAFGSGSLITTDTLAVTDDSIIRVDPALTTGGNLLDQDTGNSAQLINSTNVLSTTELARLTLQNIVGGTLGNGTTENIIQGGNTVAEALYNYALSGSGGLSVTSSLTQLNLLAGESLTLTSQGAVNADNTLVAQLTGAGNLIIGADNSATTLTNATNNYTGSTSVNGGILTLGSNDALGQTSALNTVAGTSANINGHSQTVGALTNAGTVTLGTGGALSSGLLTNSNILNIAGGTLNLSAGGASTATGGLTGSGTLNINGGDLALSAANSGLAGQTNIASGASATLSGAGTLGSSAINVLGDLNLNGANAALANVLSGTGDINTNAAVTLTGTNSFSGAHHIGAAGELTVTQASNLGASTATVGLDTATSHLVLNGVSGTIANALSGVAGSVVDVTTGANTSLTGNNSNFLGQYAVAGNSKLTVGSTNNLGAAANIALAGAQDILALSGFNGTFANTVTGSGILQVTGGSNATLTSSNAVDNAVVVDIANATLNLTDIALFDHGLTGNGTLNVAKNLASTAFDFGTSVGGAFSGIVNLTNSTFALTADNTAALANATLKLSANNVTTVGSTDRTVHGLNLNGGTLIFDGAAPQSQANGVVNVTELALNSGTVSVTGTSNWENTNPVIAPNLSILAQDRGDIMLELINGNNVTGNVNDLDLVINGTSVTSGGQAVLSTIEQGGVTVANATHNYGLTSSDGSSGTGLYVNYSLKALELLTGGNDALLLVTESGATANRVLNAALSGNGGLQVDASNGALTLANSTNTYSGATTVNAGSLILGANNAFGRTSLLDVLSGAGTNINGHSQTVGALTNAGTVTLGTGGALSSGLLTNSNILNIAGGTLNLSAGGASTATGGLTGSGTLNINGGDLALSAANSGLAGQTNIASGASATLSGAGTLGSSAVNVLGDLNLNGANAALANVLSGNGDINTNAAVTLTGTNSFSGAHHIGAAGELTVTQASNLGASTATVGLDTATSHLVLNGVSGTIANALSGVAGSVVDVTTGANTSLTGNNSNFLGQYAVAGNSKLTVGSTNNLGAAANIALAGAQDILALSGFNGTFANTVTGSGILQVTGGSNATLTSSNAVDNAVAVDIANATLNLTDIALFDHGLTGNGTLNVAKNLASTAFDFGTSVGGAFSGTVNLTNSTFALTADNTAALANATLKLSANNVTTVGSTDRTVHGLNLNGGTLIFDGAAPQSQANGVVNVTELALNSGTVSVTGTSNWENTNPVIAPNLSILAQDRGDIMLELINGNNVTGNVNDLDLVINGTSVTSGGQAVLSTIEQGGVTVANATHNYGLTSSDGSSGTGLYVNYSLKALELLTGGNDALLLVTESGATANRVLNAALSGNGGLQVDASNGALTLANSTNTYSGATTVNAGSLILGANNAFGRTSLLDVLSGAGTNINGHSQTVGALTNAGTVTLGTGGALSSGLLTNSNILNIAGGTLNLSAGGASTATGGLTGSGTLNINGGDLALSAANSGLAGQTNIASGASATLSGAGTLGSSAINVLGDLNLNGANAALANVLSGTGDINTNAAVTLTGTNSFSGAHHIGAAGELTVTQASNLGASTATVGLDTATSHLVLNGVSGTIANALSGVAGSVVDVTTGANTSLTGNNSNFLGQYAVAGNSKLTVGSTNNLGAAANIALAGAQDILALSGFNGTFANTVTGSGILQVTGGSNATLTSSNAVDNAVAVDIANATLNLTDIALFDHGLTGNGTLNVAKNLASTAFDFGTSVGGAFSGTVNLTNSTFDLNGMNTSALTNATLKLSSGNMTSVADGVQNIGGLALNGGTILFNNVVDNAGVISSEGTFAANSINTTGGGNVRVNLPAGLAPSLDGLPVMALDEGEIIVKLGTGAATGSGHELTLTDQNGGPISAVFYQNLYNPGVGSAAAVGSFNYGLTTGNSYDGLYVNYGLTALELQSTGNDALILTATLANNGKQSNDLSTQISGSGDLAFVSANEGSIASLSNATNNYTGATWVRSGSLRLDANSALGQTSQLAMSNATAVDLNGTQQTVGQLTTETGSTLNFNNGKLAVTNGGQVDGALSGAGELALSGGTLSVTQGNSGFTASTDIASGATAHLYQAQGLGSGAINNNGVLNLDNTTGVLSNNLTGASGNTQLTNNANIRLAGDNSGYSGLFTTDSGAILTANSAQNLGNSRIANSGELILDTASVWELTNAISGSGALIKRGSGTVKIEGSTVSAGLTTIENGLLQLGSLPVISALYVEESPLARSLSVSLASTIANLTSNVLITTTGSLGGYGKVTGNVENNGSLIMPNALTGGDFGTFTIDGNYTGNNGTVVFNTVLAGDSSSSDRLLITGNTAGQSYVTVNNIGGNGGRTSDGIKIINVGGDSAGQFTLNGRAVAGAYEYFLYQGSISSPTDGDWYLRTEVDERRPEPASYTANLAAANTMFVTTLADRAGETLYTDVFTGEEKTTSLWLRNEGTHNRSRDDSGELKTQDNRYVMQLGGDVAQWSRNAQDLWRVGVMAGYANSSSSSVAQMTGYRSNGSVDGYSVGMYGTWFANSQENTGAYVDSWLQYSWFTNQVDGQDLTTEKYDSKGFTAAVESGYIFKVGESAYSNFFIQPKAQVVWMGVKADSHTETNGTLVTGEGNNNIQTRLGAKAFISPIQSANKAKEPAFKPYVEANWIHNTKDFGTTLDGITVKQAGAANIAELKLGVEGQINKKLNLWGNVGQQLGNNGYSDSSITLGVKYNF
ncbi:autotransporter outer membrane beta-barrel domain-containing protein [Yersinia rochesterensis]|uniref:autotransporter outer membrane beta-barrel domain-containing protein n=1 Tax=Yersinia rochesterensis TaxID=1604335 RepID=UPI00384B99D5